MARRESETPLARRLRELAEEEEALQAKMRELARQSRKLESETGDPERVRSIQRDVRMGRYPPSAPPPVAEDRAREAAVGEPASDATTQASPPEPPPAPVGPASRRPPAVPDQRFASYLASGSFGRTRPLGHEKRLQRNKAIFMVIFVILVGFVLYRVLF